MSSLFNRKPKPFQHEEEEEISFLKKKDVKKPLSAKRDADSFLLDDSDDDDFTVKKKTRYDDDVFDLTNDNTDDYREQAKAKIKALTESSKASNVYVIDIESPARIEKEDLAAKKAKELLQQLEMSKKGTAKKSTAKASTTEVFELDYESNYVVPKVAPSIARAATTPSSSSSIHTAEYLSKLTGTSSVQSAPPRPAMTEKPQCKLKTRLNGVHERKWKIAFDESFGKVKAKYAAVYGLKITDVKFEFDGEAVKDAHTPQALEMEPEDENMIDVKIDKALYAAAVSTADAQNNGTSTVPAARSEPEKPSLRIRMRLNGSHEWKCKFSPEDSFAKVRAKYAEVYGLRAADVKFEFDGEAVKDSHTPGLLGMEDDNMIDVKIDKKLFAVAVACANAKR